MAVNTRLERILAFLVGAALVSVLGLVFDGLLFSQGVPKMAVLLCSNVITGVTAGVLYLHSRVRDSERKQELEDRLRKIADMNHHVRNALTVVQFYGAQRGDHCATEAVQEAVMRIEWTLREVLPKGWNLEERVPESLLKKSKAAACSHVN
jgi:hypothetical protein